MKKKVLFVDICNSIANVNSQLNLMGYQTDVYPSPVPADVFTEELFRAAEPIWPVINVVKRLSERHSIVYLTARPEKVRTVTLEWLKAYDLPAGPLVHTNGRLKGEIALELVCADWIAGAVEDSPHEIEGYLKLVPGMQVLVPDWPHNKEITRGIRIPLFAVSIAVS
jgi:hypothetical protein